MGIFNRTLNPSNLWRTLVPLALVSASILNFEVVLTRVIAIQHWHHLTSVVIAIALLGFGFAGSLGAVFARYISKQDHRLIKLSALGTALSIPLSLMLAKWVPFNMLALPWFWHQTFYLLLYSLCLLLPFLFGALYITITFMRQPDAISKLYGADLFGAAIGALLALMIMENGSIDVAIATSLSLALLALCMHLRMTLAHVILMGTLVTGLFYWVHSSLVEVSPSQFKELPIRLSERNARILWQGDSSQSRLTLVESPGQHAAPGLSINSTLVAPKQWRLFIDGDMAIPLLLDADNPKQGKLFSQIITAAPYLITPSKPSVLLLGGNHSWNAWTAHWHGARSIVVVERDRALLKVLGGSGQGIVRRNFLPKQTGLHATQPRRFIQASSTHYDLIMASVSRSAVGAAAAQMNYEMTQEALTGLFEQLTDIGVLAISNPMAPLPKDNLRLVNSITQVLSEHELDASRHLIILRDWRTIMLMVTRRPLSDKMIGQIKIWCERWSFDLAALPGLTQEQTNRHHVKDQALYFKAIQTLMSKQADFFTNHYVFNISPTTDNNPFFSHSFRWTSFNHLRSTLGQQWPLYVGWGYLLGIASLVMLSFVAGVFIFGPLYIRCIHFKPLFSLLSAIVYFGCIGLGFMFIEIGLLYKAALILDSPTITFATVITAILIGAGLGSLLWGGKSMTSIPVLGVATAIGFLGCISLLLFDAVFQVTLHWSWYSRTFLVFLIVALLAFPMGLFLPHGIARIRERGTGIVAWCWGINGFASVLGVLAAPLIAMNAGFNALMIGAGVCYLLAGMANHVIRTDSNFGQ